MTNRQRSGLLVARHATVSMNPDAPEDVNPAGIIIKQYAHAEDTGGIPLDELPDLLGVKQQTFLAEITDREDEWRYSAVGRYTAQLYPHSVTRQIIHVSDFLRITCTRNYLVGGVPTSDSWTFRTNSDNWFELTESSQGDTLVSEMTGVVLRSEGNDDDYLPAEIMIGRSADNEVLIQTRTLILPIAHPEARMAIRIEFETYGGGILGRRMAEQRAFRPEHKLAFKRRSSTALTESDVPDADDITYDGTHLAVTASSAWVVAWDDDPAGSDTLYYAGTTASYDYIYGTWTINAKWTISSTAPADTRSSFAVLYSAGETGMRHSPRATGDTWVWLRKPDGYWDGFPFDQSIVIPDRNVQILATWTITDGLQPYTGYIRRTLTTPIDRADYRFIVVHFRHYTEHYEDEAIRTMALVSPQNALAAGADFGTTGHDNMVAAFPTNTGAFLREDDGHVSGVGGLRFSIRFERGSDTGSDVIHSIAIGRWTTSTPAVITVKAY